MGTSTQMQQLWDGTETPEGGRRKTPPDGDYVAKIKTFEKTAGKYGDQLEVEFHIPKFLKSEEYWDSLKSWYGIPDPNHESAEGRTKALKGLMKSLGVTVSGFDGIFAASTRNQVVGMEVKINKSTNGKYTNIYVNEVLSKGGNGKIETPAVEVTADDIPF